MQHLQQLLDALRRHGLSCCNFLYYGKQHPSLDGYMITGQLAAFKHDLARSSIHKSVIQCLLCHLAEIIVLITQQVGCSTDRGHNLGVVRLAQYWQQLLANSIPPRSDIVIRLILTPIQASIERVGTQIVSSEFQKGTQQALSGRRHPSQTGSTASSEQTQKDCFRLVIGVMGQQDPLRIRPVGDASKEGPTAESGRHLN
jgi:hypothetical protein